VTDPSEPNPYPRRKWVEYGALPAAILFWVAVFLFAPRGPNRRRSNCLSNLKCLTYVLALYAGDNNEAFPPDLGTLMGPSYVSDGQIFLCPESGPPVSECKSSLPGTFTDSNLSYIYVSGLSASDDPGYVLAFDEEWNHGGKGVNVAYIGGQVIWRNDIAALHEQLAKQEAELAAKGRTMTVIRPSWSTWPARPPWLVRRSRVRWIAGGVTGGAFLLAAAAMLVVLRRRRRRLAAALTNPT